MATKQPVKKASSTTTDILEELRTLNESVEELHEFLVRSQKRASKRRVWNGVTGGLLHATGLVLGTIIVTAALVYGGQFIVRSNWFQDWIQASVQEILQNAILNQSP